jgi:glycerol kinase
MQFQADILGCGVRPTCSNDRVGAAYLAGLHTGVWSSLEEIAAQWQMQRRFEPSMARADAEALLERWHEAVNRSRRWSSDKS